MTILREFGSRVCNKDRYHRAAVLGLAPSAYFSTSRQLFLDTVTILALVGAAVLAISITLIYAGDFDWYFAALTMGTYLLGSWLVVAKLKGYPHQRFGPANTITALRGGLTCLMAGFLVETEWLIDPTMTSWIWGVVAGSLLALCLDGLDGYLARRFEMTSEFGARYDMEVDAALILCLSLLIYAMAKADWWVIFIGAMRYLFVAAQFFDSRLKRPLQPSLRRKAICVLQMVALCTILLPTVNPPVSTSIAAWALLALVCSFGSDVYSLMRRQARPLTMTKRGASNADLPVSSPITAKMPRETLAPAPGSKVV